VFGDVARRPEALIHCILSIGNCGLRQHPRQIFARWRSITRFASGPNGENPRSVFRPLTQDAPPAPPLLDLDSGQIAWTADDVKADAGNAIDFVADTRVMMAEKADARAQEGDSFGQTLRGGDVAASPLLDRNPERRIVEEKHVERSPMGAWLASGPDLRAKVPLLRDVARAVHHARRHGVIHRDLKPANVLVDRAGVAHVTDFGLARPIASDGTSTLTGSGMLRGTPAYMSPEQARGDHDVYALGVMLYEILTGRRPFEGSTPMETVAKVLTTRPPPPTGCDPALARTCMQAAERHASAEAFVADLERWLEPAAPVRRGLGGIGVAAAAVVLLIAAGVVLLWPATTVLLEADGGTGPGELDQAAEALRKRATARGLAIRVTREGGRLGSRGSGRRRGCATMRSSSGSAGWRSSRC
jgi:hypothetical protein